MGSFCKSLRLLGDEGRLRILRLLSREELSVAELQEILGMGQSRISMQLSQLKQAGFVELRKAGQKSLYWLTAPPGAKELLEQALRHSDDLSGIEQDDRGLRLALQKRKDQLRGYFDELAGRFGRHYVPGRSWKGMAEMILRLLPPLVIADLGAGEGTVSLLLAQRARRVIAVDNSERMVEYASDVARRHGVENLECRLGDLEELPMADGEADVALFHQSLHHALHPAKAVAEAYRVLKPGGRILIVDLHRHGFEQARELYADVWLGFGQPELLEWIEKAGFSNPDITLVHREEDAPHFETVLAVGDKP
jgi:ubiquinone/menaquinone biosynthesis C-methylase UbiE/DNA-binding HxlR family transcriptional regulator